MSKSESKDIVSLNVEAALNLIPCVGGSLATYFGETRNKKVAERMQKYFTYFSNRLNEIEDRKIDYEYLKSEEFAEFFMQGAEQAARSVTEKRIKRFANILINNAITGSKARSRTQSIMSFVDRISDLDAFVLLAYGNPNFSSLRAQTKDESVDFVRNLSKYLGINCPDRNEIIEAAIYMDNLGVMWINEKQTDELNEKGKDLILKEFSSFRTPLGNAVTTMISPPGFYLNDMENEGKLPDDYVSPKYKGMGY